MSHWTGPQMEGSMSLRLSSVAGEVSSAPCLHHCLQRCLVTGSQASRQEVCVEEFQLIGEYQTKVWNSQGQIRAVFLKYLWSLSSFTWWSCMHTCENAHTHTQTKLSLNILIFSIYLYFFFFGKHHTPCPYLWRFWVNKCEVIHRTPHFSLISWKCSWFPESLLLVALN